MRHYNVRTNDNWEPPQDKPKAREIKLTEHGRELIIRSIEHMMETYLDLMKGPDVEDSDHLNKTYEQYQKLASKIKAPDQRQ
jgi:hypothetical protein